MAFPALGLELVARLHVSIAQPYDGGTNRVGERSTILPITGGTVEGPLLEGDVLPVGADWGVARADGTFMATAKYLIRTHDGIVLTVINTGVISAGPGGSGLTSPKIEAPKGSYDWLNDAVLVGSLIPHLVDEVPKGVTMEFYRVRRV